MSRYRRGMTDGQKAGAAIAAGVALAILTHQPSHAATNHHHDAAGMAIPGAPSSGWTPGSWAHAMLTAAHLPRTRCNLAAVTAWERAEGGNWANAAKANPLDTTMPEPGSWSMNSASVQAYPSWRTGLRATVSTLRNGRYPAILSSLRSGHDAQAVADAVASSPWGTSAFQAGC